LNKGEGIAVRKKLIAANWKMYKTVSEAEEFIKAFLPGIAGMEGIDVALCPPFTCLAVVGQGLRGSLVELGAQDVFWESYGAYTGEISSPMLLDLGCRYVIIGHSERRHILGESELAINRKLRAASQAGLIPIFCVGETLQQRDKDLALEVVSQQLEKGLRDIPSAELVVAYEPVWAIGTGVNASPEDAQEMCGFIRDHLARLYDASWAERVRIIYGGSVKAENISHYVAQADVDGALVGGASLEALNFARMVRLDGNA
jgi:triosephosphate isomerase